MSLWVLAREGAEVSRKAFVLSSIFIQNGINPNRSLGRLMYNFNNCLQSFAFYKASFARF